MGTVLSRRFADLVLVGAAVGFLVILAELLLMEHWDGLQRLAPAAAAAGAAACLLAVIVHGRARYALAAFLGVLSLAGFYGFYLHMEERGGFSARAFDEGSPQGTPGPDGEQRRGGPAPLAPLSVAGTALLGSLASAAGARERGPQPARVRGSLRSPATHAR